MSDTSKIAAAMKEAQALLADTPGNEVDATCSERTIAQAEQEHAAAMRAYNAALAAQDFGAAKKAENTMERAEETYMEAAQTLAFAACKASGQPMRRAAQLHSFRILKHKPLRAEGVILGLEADHREKPINLMRLAEYCDLPTPWSPEVERLNYALTMRAAKQMGADAQELSQLAESYYMTREAGKIEDWRAFTNKAALVKQLQDICDKILGAGAIRVNHHDVAYIEASQARKGRERISINTANQGFMRRLILDVLHRRVSGKAYEYEYKKWRNMAIK